MTAHFPRTATPIVAVAAGFMGFLATVAPATALELTGGERAYVAHRLAAGETTIRLYLMAQPGRSSELSARVKKAGADVLMTATDIDLIYAEVPIDKIPAVLAWKEWTAVEAASEDGPLTNLQAAADGAPAKKRPGPAPNAFTPRDNPYTAEASTGSLQFKQKHPTYDGRGVVIGGIEPVDIRAPAMQYALSLQGARIPKFFDYIIPPPVKELIEPLPRDDQADYWWQKSVAVERGTDGNVSFGDHTYKLPEAAAKGTGELRMAYWRYPSVNFSMGAGEYALLWDVPGRRIWTYMRHPEENETTFGEPVAFDVLPEAPNRVALAQFPADDKRTMMIAVDLPTKALRLRAGSMTHGTMCASVAAGSGFVGSQAEGVAPAAQFFPVDYSSRNGNEGNFTQLLAWMTLYRNPKVDVLTNSTVFARTRQWASEDRALYGQLFERLTKKYPKPHFRAAANSGPSEDFFVEYPKASSSIIAVGAYTPREAWAANFGITPTNPYTMAPYSSYGPAFDGALKPDLLGLTGTLSAAKQEWVDDGASAYFDTPEGYFISGGTSAATPNAAGHGALLVSAAKQAGIPYDLPRLKMALFSTAKFLEGIEARVQGHGLVQVDQAWDALVKLKNYDVPQFVTQAPVRTPFSDKLTPANVGRGLYERVGWGPQQSGDREITLKRISGPGGAVKYRLRWQGDSRQAVNRSGRHDTFSSPLTEISLPLNAPVKLPVHIQVAESGAYSAIVDLVDPGNGLVVHSVMCTIIAAEPLNKENGYTRTVTRSVPRPGHGIMFVNVPEGTSGLRVEVQQTNGKNVVLRALNPIGQMPLAGMGKDYAGRDAATVWMLTPSDRKSYDQTFVRPMPGVWQFWVTHDGGLPPKTYDPKEAVPALAAEATFKVSVVDVEATAGEPVQAADAQSVQVSFASNYGDIQQAKIETLGVGAAREESPTLMRTPAPQFYEIEVPAGTTRLTAQIDAAQDTKANLSLGVFYLTGKKDSPVARLAYDATAGTRKFIQVPSPKPGRYKIAIDAWGDVPASGVRVNYRDTLFHTIYGRETSTDTATDLKAGERKQAQLQFKVDTYPAPGRRLLAEVGLFGKSYVNMAMPTDYAERASAADKAGKPAPKVTIINEPVPLATQLVLLPAR